MSWTVLGSNPRRKKQPWEMTFEEYLAEEQAAGLGHLYPSDIRNEWEEWMQEAFATGQQVPQHVMDSLTGAQKRFFGRLRREELGWLNELTDPLLTPEERREIQRVKAIAQERQEIDTAVARLGNQPILGLPRGGLARYNALRAEAIQLGVYERGMSMDDLERSLVAALQGSPDAPAFAAAPMTYGSDLEAVKAATQRMGGPGGTPRGTAVDPDWAKVVELGASIGKTRAEIKADLVQANISEPRGAYDFLVKKYLGGYEQTKKAWLAKLEGRELQEAEAGFPKHHTWQRIPEHKRTRMRISRPVSTLPTEYGQPVIPEGWIRRAGASHIFHGDVLRGASFLGQIRGKTALTYPTSKLEKRMQQLGAHETVRLTGLKAAPESLREGPLMLSPEQAQVARMALVIGGGVGGPGAMLVDPSVGMGVQREYRELRPKEGYTLGAPARVGDVFMPGGRMVLAGGHAGERTGKWRYTVQDVIELQSGGYGFVLERAAKLAQLRGRMKFASAKGEFSVRDLSGVTTAAGVPLNLHMLGELKDPQGAIYAWYKARGTDYLRESLSAHRRAHGGLKGKFRSLYSRDKLPGTYQELGPEVMAAWWTQESAKALTTIHKPEILTAENLARFQKSGAVVPGTAKEIEPGLFRAMLQYQALVGEFGVQVSQDYPVKRSFLSAEELRNLRRSGPRGAEQYARIMEYSAAEREARRDVFGAAMASMGAGKPLPGTTAVKDITGMSSMVSSAKETVARRMGLDPTGGVPYDAMVGEFMRSLVESEYGDVPLSVASKFGSLYMPSARVMGKFGAGGQWEDDEMSAYVKRSYDAIVAAAGGAGIEETQLAVARGRMAQEEIAGGKEFQRTLEGAFLQQAAGDVLRTSLALKTGQVYIPGLEPGPVNMMRYPTEGPESHKLIATNVSEEYAKKLGINTQEMTASLDVIQALAADVDGDLGYAIQLGTIEVRPDGRLYDTVEKRYLNNEKDILAAAKRRVKMGAADLYRSEMAGMGGSALGYEGAKRKLYETIMGTTLATPEEMQKHIVQGSHLRGLIGQYYNVFRGGAQTTPRFARAAWQQLFNLSHERAQRPEEQLPAMRRFHQLAKMNLLYSPKDTKSLMRSRGAWVPETGTFEPFGTGQAGGEALKQEALSALIDVRDPETGKLMFGAKRFAQAMSPMRKRVGAMSKAFGQYHAAATPQEQRTARARISALMGPWQEWGARSAVGAGLVPAAVGRAYALGQKLGYGEEAIAGAMDLTPTQMQGLLGLRETQELTNVAYGRRRFSGVRGFLRKAQALTRVGLGRWLSGGWDMPEEQIQEIEALRTAEAEFVRSGQRGTAPPFAPTDADIPAEAAMGEAGAWAATGGPREGGAPRDIRGLAQQMYVYGLGMPVAKWNEFFGAATENWTDAAKRQLKTELKGMGLTPRGGRMGPPPGQPPKRPSAAEKATAPGPGGGFLSTPYAIPNVDRMIPVGYDPVARKALDLETGRYIPGVEYPLGAGGIAEAPTGGGGAGETDRWQRLTNAMFGVSSREFAVTQELFTRNLPFFERTFGPSITTGRTLGKEGIAASSQMAKWARKLERGLRQRGGGDLVSAGLLTPEQQQMISAGEIFAEQSAFERKAGLATGRGEVAELTQEHVKTLRTLNRRLDEWEKAVKPAIESGRELTTGQRRATIQLMRMMGDVPGIAQAARGAGNVPVQLQAAMLQARGGARLGRAQETITEQEWQQLLATGAAPGGPSIAQRGIEAARRLMVGWTPMQMARAWGITGGAVFGQYVPAAAQAEMAGWRVAAAMGGGGLPEGVAGGVMRFEAERRQSMIEAGRAGYRAWGAGIPLMNWMRQAQAIAGPPAGVGLMTGIGLNALGGVFPTLGRLAGPVGFGIMALGTALGTAQYTSSFAAPTAENQIRAATPGGDVNVLKGLIQQQSALPDIFDTIGLQTPLIGNVAARLVWETSPEVRERYTEMVQQGRYIRGAALNALTGQQRMGALNYVAQQLRERTGTIFEGMSEEQIVPAIGQMMQFRPGMEQMSADMMVRLGLPDVARMLELGYGPERYADLAQQLGMGPEGAGQMFDILGSRLIDQRTRQRWERGYAQYAPLRRFGADISQINQLTFQAGPLYGQAEMVYNQLVSGDQRAWNWLAQRGVAPQVARTMDRFGLPAATRSFTPLRAAVASARQLYGGISLGGFGGGWAGVPAALMQEGGGQVPLSIGTADLTVGGLWGLEDWATAEQRAYQGWQFGFQRQGLALEARHQYATWGIQDRMRAENARSQMAMFGIQGGQIAASDRQFREQLAFQREQAEVQFGWQETDINTRFERAMVQLTHQMSDLNRNFGRQMVQFGWQEEDIWTQRGRGIKLAQWQEEDITRQYQRQMVQFGWAEEDIAFQRYRGGLQFGWQMEDIEEAIRFSGGRQRKRLMRQRERATTMYGLEESRFDTEEDRLQQRREWATEDFERERDRFRERRGWQEEDWERELERLNQRRAWAGEDYETSRGRLEEQRRWYTTDFERDMERHEQRKEWSEESFEMQLRHHEERVKLQWAAHGEAVKHFKAQEKLQKELDELNRGYWKAQHARQVTALKRAEEHAKKMNQIQDVQTQVARGLELQQNVLRQIFSMFDPSGAAMRAITEFINHVTSSLEEANSQAQIIDGSTAPWQR